MKKRKLKGWVWLFIGFMIGIIYSNLFIYSDLIKENSKETIEKNLPFEINVAKIEKKCKLDEISCKIKTIADEYDVDWKLAIAISKHETGNYKSNAFKNLNNVGGNFRKGKLMKFETLEEGIKFFVNNIKVNYINKGLTSIEDIGNKYCPVGINDNGNNKYWIPRVTKNYESLGQ